MRSAPPAFTLVELLVVITVILVLLAMLVPALDQAIYQAELATCAAQLGGVGKGVTVYAVDYKRRYPLRPGVEANDENHQPHDLVAGVWGPGIEMTTDQRALIKGMFSLKMLVDPLTQEVDLERQEEGLPQIVMTGYCMWWGWGYRGERKMARLGDRFTWTGLADPQAAGDPRTARFDLLVSDRHHLKIASEAQTSHPDKNGTLVSMRLQNSTDNPWIPAFQVTQSFWYGRGSDQHGPMDMSYTHADGSVSRLTDQAPYDSRTFATPERLGTSSDGRFWLFIPESR
jgi:prepilin-type N-terminal cleavage/methylation domain-containing protein